MLPHALQKLALVVAKNRKKHSTKRKKEKKGGREKGRKGGKDEALSLNYSIHNQITWQSSTYITKNRHSTPLAQSKPNFSLLLPMDGLYSMCVLQLSLQQSGESWKKILKNPKKKRRRWMEKDCFCFELIEKLAEDHFPHLYLYQCHLFQYGNNLKWCTQREKKGKENKLWPGY